MLIIYLMVEIEGARQGTKLGFFVLQLPAGQLSPLNYNFRRQARVFWPQQLTLYMKFSKCQ
jgi:hypothetical protein